MAQKQGLLKEFKEFIATGDLITTAIGLIIALKVADVIKSFMDGVVNPVIGAIIGKPDFNELFAFDLGDARVMPGMVITTLVSLVITGFVLFMLMKQYKKMKAASTAAAGPTEVDLLTEIRDSLRSR